MPRVIPTKLILYSIFLVVADMSFVPAFRFGNFQPVFSYLLILYAGFVWHWQSTLVLALIVGICRDLVGTHPYGLETIALVSTSLMMDFMVQKLDRQTVLTRILLTFLFTFSVTNQILFFSHFLEGPVPYSWTAFVSAFSASVATAVIMPFFFYLNGLIFRDQPSLKQYELFS